MAEGLARHLGKGVLEPFSAGLIPTRVDSRAIKVMNELGIDISGQKPKAIDETLLRTMDVVITLCSNAVEACPVTPPEITRIHWPIEDPVGAVGADEVVLWKFRQARDEIRDRMIGFIKETAARNLSVSGLC